MFAAARENLTGAVLQGVAGEPVVVQFMDDGDAYWTSHLLLDGWLARLAEQVGGVPVAFAPERGTLIVAADGSAHLPVLFAQAEQVYVSSPRAITPMAYVSDEHGRTVPYAAPEGHPLHQCVLRAEAVLAVHGVRPPGADPCRSRRRGGTAAAGRLRDERVAYPGGLDPRRARAAPVADEVLLGDRGRAVGRGARPPDAGAGSRPAALARRRIGPASSRRCTTTPATPGPTCAATTAPISVM